jgi:hypothetical protein
MEFVGPKSSLHHEDIRRVAMSKMQRCLESVECTVTYETIHFDVTGSWRDAFVARESQVQRLDAFF